MPTDNGKLLQLLTDQQRITLSSVRSHAETILGNSPRFKYFTLHGKQHIDNLFALAGYFIEAGINLDNEEAYLLSLAICIHDLGMVAPLQKDMVDIVLEGRPFATDPAILETFIRETHHELAERYLQENTNFLTANGLSPTQLFNVLEISKCHRKIILDKKTGFIRYLGALLRTIDELDIGSNRAPIAALLNNQSEFDSTSTWHWFKHNITQDWKLGHNVQLKSINGQRAIEFQLIVCPTRKDSIPYWINQIRRPILRVLKDEGCAAIIKEKWGLQTEFTWHEPDSAALELGPTWAKIEDFALSSGRKVILVVDDENRKLQDLFRPLMDSYYVAFAANAKDAIQKLAAIKVDLAIVDMQIGSGFIWSAEQTNNFKATGKMIAHEIKKQSPHTLVGILTGTRHPTDDIDKTALAFFLRKPIDPDALFKKVSHVLR